MKSGKTVAVYGEGDHELGGRKGVSLGPEELPALPIIVHRLVGEPAGVRYQCDSFLLKAKAHGKTRNLEQKVRNAILRAKLGRFDALVILRDRDDQGYSELVNALMRARDQLSKRGYPACAVGVAIKTFDAWMIADGNAIGKAGGEAASSHPAAEKCDDPKARACEILGYGLATKYEVIAKYVNLEFLAEKACPKGFAPFSTEVMERIRPVLVPHKG